MIRCFVRALLVCGSVLTVSAAYAGPKAGDLLWQATFDLAGGNDRATAVTAEGGRVVVVGSAQTTTGHSDFMVRAHDARTGALLWKDSVDVAGGDDEALSVVMDDRRVVVAGTGTDSTGASRALVRAYEAKTGALLWKDAWAGRGAGLGLDGDRLIVAGNLVNPAGVNELLVRAYIVKTGAMVWQDTSLPTGYTGIFFPTFPGSGSEPKAIAVRGGKAFVSAIVTPAGDFGGSACLVRGYNATTGAVLWEAAHHMSGTCTPAGIGVDKRRVILGATGGIGGDNLVVQGHDALSGALLWQTRTFVGSGLDNAVTGVDAERGLAFISAWDNHLPWTTPGFKETFIVRSYDTATGVLRWEDVHQVDELGSYLWHGLDIEVEKGRVFAVGQDVGHGTWLVRAYDAKRGDILWQNESPGGAGDYSVTQAVAVNGGRIFVVGTGSNAAGNTDMLLRAYDAK